MSAVLDTHVAIWYLIDAKNLPDKVFSMIDAAVASGVPTYISAVTLVEVVYLVERGRIVPNAFDRFAQELGKENPAFRVVPLDRDIAGILRTFREMRFRTCQTELLRQLPSTLAFHWLPATDACRLRD